MPFTISDTGQICHTDRDLEGWWVNLRDFGRGDCRYDDIVFDTIVAEQGKSGPIYSICVPLDWNGLRFLLDVLKQNPDIEDREAIHRLYDQICAAILEITDEFDEIKGAFYYV